MISVIGMTSPFIVSAADLETGYTVAHNLTLTIGSPPPRPY